MVTIDKLIEYNLKLIAIGIPLFFIGIKLNEYPLSVTMMLIILLDILLIIRGRYDKNILFTGLMLVLWALITNAGRHPLTSFVASWTAFVLVIFPLWATYPSQINRDSLGRWLIAGFLLSSIFALYEILSIFIHLPELKEVLRFGLWEKVTKPSFMVLRRVKASMQEPSHYAKYLVFIYVIADSDRFSKALGKFRPYLRFFILIVLISTISLTGYLMIIVYFGLKLLTMLKKKFLEGFRITPKYIVSFTLFIVLILALLQNETAQQVFFKNYDRISKLYEVIDAGNTAGSEGSRGNSILIMGEYLTQQGVSNFIWGEGYANYEKWLEKKYNYLSRSQSSYARGRIPNIFAGVGISMGFTGLLLFCLFLYLILKNSDIKYGYYFKVYFLILLFASGGLISYLLWAILLIASCLFYQPLYYLENNDI